MDEIIRAYPGMSVLGWGGFGITVLVISPDQKEMVLKISGLTERVEWTTEEVSVGCGLSTLRQKTPFFGEVYGWQYCTGVPEKWREIFLETLHPDKIDNLQLRELFLSSLPVKIIAMEHNGVAFSKIRLTKEEKRQVLFLILHGLLTARETYPGFRHRDLHSGNLLLKVRDPAIPLQLRLPISGDAVEIIGVTYIPRLIDYGNATMYAEPELLHLGERDSDIGSVASLSSTFARFLDDVYYNRRPFDESLLLDPLFESFVNVQRKRVKIESFCQQCFSGPATIQHAKEPSRVYCGEACFVKSNKLF